jgi:hypothetical protein
VCVCVCPKACEALVLGYMTSLEAKKFSFSFGSMYLATISRGDPNTTGDNNVINVYSSDSFTSEPERPTRTLHNNNYSAAAPND